MTDTHRDERKKANRTKGPKTPPRTRDYPLETPYYEEQFDPYFTEDTEPVKDEDEVQPLDPEEEWYWREPDNYWLEEGMWPWPDPRPRRKEEFQPPADTEPPGAKQGR